MTSDTVFRTVNLDWRLRNLAKSKGFDWPKQLQLLASNGRQLLRGLYVNLLGWHQVIEPSYLTVATTGRVDCVAMAECPDAMLEYFDYTFRLSRKGGGGLLRAVVGVVLIAASFLIPGSGFLLSAGVALAAGGVLEMLTPKTKANTQEAKDRAQSYLFSTLDGKPEDADPVPVAFGRLRLLNIPALSTELTQEQ